MSVTTPRADAANALFSVQAVWQNGTATRNAAMIGLGSMNGVYLGRLGPAAPPASFHGSIAATYAQPTADGSFENSPYIYDLAWFRRSTFFDGFHGTVRDRDLATLPSTYATEATGAIGTKANGAILTPDDGYYAPEIHFALPFHRTEYVNTEPGALWLSRFFQLIPAANGSSTAISQTDAAPAQLRAGRTYPQQWNRAVFGPLQPLATRTHDDLMTFTLPMFSEGSGHPGFSSFDTTGMALSSGGKLIGRVDSLAGQFTVQPGPARYQLDADATRSAPHTLSTAVHATWTFRSQHADSDAQLPLLSVRMSPALDENNSAPAGRPYAIPLTASAPVSAIGAEVSFDDGHTWQPAPVRGSGTVRTAVVRHPARAGFVSLRIHAQDRAGNSVSQTVIRAYPIA
jgi:hypothetical protein